MLNVTNPREPAPVLTGSEVTSRVSLLAELKAALAEEGVQSVLARRTRIVLRDEGFPGSFSSPADPQLYVFSRAGDEIDTVTTDGTCYQLTSGRAFAVSDPRAAASVIAWL
jgi:hypothetical protein